MQAVAGRLEERPQPLLPIGQGSRPQILAVEPEEVEEEELSRLRSRPLGDLARLAEIEACLKILEARPMFAYARDDLSVYHEPVARPTSQQLQSLRDLRESQFEGLPASRVDPHRKAGLRPAQCTHAVQLRLEAPGLSLREPVAGLGQHGPRVHGSRSLIGHIDT